MSSTRLISSTSGDEVLLSMEDLESHRADVEMPQIRYENEPLISIPNSINSS